MRFGTRPDAPKTDEVGLPTPERDGLGAALRSAFESLDNPISDEIETRLAKIDTHPAGGSRRG